MEFVWIALLGIAVTVFVTRPFWGGAEATQALDPEIAALEAARESKYREIRDARIDRDSGKLPEEDFEILNAELRRDAIGMLDRLEQARGGSGPENGPGETPADGEAEGGGQPGKPSSG